MPLLLFLFLVENKLTFLRSEFNFAARLENASAASPWSFLRPLKAPGDQPIIGFPATRSSIDALDGELQALPACWH